MIFRYLCGTDKTNERSKKDKKCDLSKLPEAITRQPSLGEKKFSLRNTHFRASDNPADQISSIFDISTCRSVLERPQNRLDIMDCGRTTYLDGP